MLFSATLCVYSQALVLSDLSPNTEDLKRHLVTAFSKTRSHLAADKGEAKELARKYIKDYFINITQGHSEIIFTEQPFTSVSGVSIEIQSI